MLSDASRRQHYIESPRQDWRAFFDACGEDPVIEEVHTLLDLLDPELQIVLLTARPHRVALPHRGVAAPLRDPVGPAHHAAVGRLRPRPRLQAVDGLGAAVAPASSCALAFEDDRRNVAMFRAEGIPCLYVHSGYYD